MPTTRVFRVNRWGGVMNNGRPVSMNLAMFTAQGWIELEPEVDRGEVSHALDALLHQRMRSSDFVDALLAVPGVVEVFASDDELDIYIGGLVG